MHLLHVHSTPFINMHRGACTALLSKKWCTILKKDTSWTTNCITFSLHPINDTWQTLFAATAALIHLIIWLITAHTLKFIWFINDSTNALNNSERALLLQIHFEILKSWNSLAIPPILKLQLSPITPHLFWTRSAFSYKTNGTARHASSSHEKHANMHRSSFF